MSEELDLLISLGNGSSGTPIPKNRLLFQRYIIYRLEGNPDPLENDDSLRAFSKWMEQTDLIGRILRTDKEKISKIRVNPCNLRVGLGAEQVLRRK